MTTGERRTDVPIVLVDTSTGQTYSIREIGDGWIRNAFTGELQPWGRDYRPPQENRIFTVEPKD